MLPAGRHTTENLCSASDFAKDELRMQCLISAVARRETGGSGLEEVSIIVAKIMFF